MEAANENVVSVVDERTSKLESYQTARAYTAIAGVMGLAALGFSAKIIHPAAGTAGYKLLIGLLSADVVATSAAVAVQSYQIHKLRQNVLPAVDVAVQPEAANDSVFYRFYKYARRLFFRSPEEIPLLANVNAAYKMERGELPSRATP
ncbi:MAG TPA: hypothetical protein VGV92_05010 [Gammaproteobacteria bacterium]|nr:hypothetical protein [Gammaproteobacteria bacterium]